MESVEQAVRKKKRRTACMLASWPGYYVQKKFKKIAKQALINCRPPPFLYAISLYWL